VNTLRGKIAAQLRKLVYYCALRCYLNMTLQYGVHLCASSWRIRSFNQTMKRDTAKEHRPSICNLTSLEQHQLRTIGASAVRDLLNLYS